MKYLRSALRARQILAVTALAAAGTGCSGGNVTLAPAASPAPHAGATATPTAAGGAPTATPSAAAATASPTAASATPTPASTVAPTATPTGAATTAAACGTVYTFTTNETGGQIVQKATSACANAVTLDYPSFTLTPATSPNPYKFTLDDDTKNDSTLSSVFGTTELCNTPPGVFYLAVSADAGPSGPTINFGSTGPDGVGGTLVSPAFVSGRTYTAYAAVTQPVQEELGSTTFTASTSGTSGSISGGTLTVTPPNTSFPSGTTGEIEVCYPS